MLPLGKVRGHRGRHGELTVDVLAGDAAVWEGLRKVWIGTREGQDGRFYAVETSRSYRDRLVLKLRGLDDPTRVGRLRGLAVKVPLEEAPALPPGEHWVARLVGLRVYDEQDRLIGEVRDVLPTGGADLLIVEPSAEEARVQGKTEELMIPLAKSIVLEISPERGRITVRPPEGLLDLNRHQRGGEGSA
jgi:16S rRNA processing protein RimM